MIAVYWSEGHAALLDETMKVSGQRRSHANAKRIAERFGVEEVLIVRMRKESGFYVDAKLALDVLDYVGEQAYG